MNPAPVFFSTLLSCSFPLCSHPPLWCGGWRRFSGGSWMHGYPAVRGCEVDIMLVGCRQLLKYNLDIIMHRKEREGRKANPTESFAIFAPFAVNQIMKPSSHPLFRSPAAWDCSTPSQPGAPFDLPQPAAFVGRCE